MRTILRIVAIVFAGHAAIAWAGALRCIHPQDVLVYLRMALQEDRFQIRGYQDLIRVFDLDKLEKESMGPYHPKRIAALLAMNTLQSINEDLYTTIVHMGQRMRVPLLNFRPQQFGLAQALLTYGNVTPDSTVLEIGYGLPSVLALLRSFTKGHLVGVDVNSLPREAISAMQDDLQIMLLQGNAPHDKKTTQEIGRLGPYRVIAAGDVFKANIKMGAQFMPEVSMEDYIRFLKDSLAPKGRIIILNDNNKRMVFTREDIEHAKLNVIAWEKPFLLPEKVRMYLKDPDENWGHMMLYVLEKGE